MPNEIIITSQADFELGTIVPYADTTVVPGDVVLTNGTGEYDSHRLDAGGGKMHLFLKVWGNRPTGSAYAVRFRTADTEEGLAEAVWSKWYGDVDADGWILVNVWAEQLNESRTTGRWLELQAPMIH